MNYTHLLNELNKANTFDLYRLHVAIGNELENNDRILKIKQKLRIGMQVSYFHYVENRLVVVELLEIRQKNVVIHDHNKNKRFVVPYYMLNIDGSDTNIHESKNSENLTANMLKVGDCVGFNNNGRSVIGVVKRINHKTVTLETKQGPQWRVAYSFLYRIHDAETTIKELQTETYLNGRG